MSKTKVPDFEAMVRQLLKDAEVYAAVTGLNFFKESFEVQGWRDGAFYAWPERKTGSDGRALLIQTGDLRDSLRILQQSPLQIVFGSSSPKAALHNYGGTLNIKITPRSRKFFWYMFKATGDSKWKAMALTKNDTLTIRVPQRQFIGESQTLMTDLDRWLHQHKETVFKAYLNKQ